MNAIKKIFRFIVVGALAAAVNIAAMYILTASLHMDGTIQRNLANFLAMLMGVTTAFILNRQWTWEDSPKKAGTGLVYQYFAYCTSAGAGAILRIVLFAALDYLTSVHYLFNVMIGIGAAAFLDFFLYNKFVFASQNGVVNNSERGSVNENKVS